VEGGRGEWLRCVDAADWCGRQRVCVIECVPSRMCSVHAADWWQTARIIVYYTYIAYYTSMCVCVCVCVCMYSSLLCLLYILSLLHIYGGLLTLQRPAASFFQTSAEYIAIGAALIG
jgi:hypothetical protein